MSNKTDSDKVLHSVEKVSGVPSNSTDAMLTCNVDVSAPLPCIVILIHGVNDIGEAFENQDQGICEGLNKRLGRCDLIPNKWATIQEESDNFAPRIAITKSHYSPVIPFFWGYRPVDKQKYDEDQRAYEKRLKDPSVIDPELPYSSYWLDREFKLDTGTLEVDKLNSDNFFNWIDYGYHRNGGPFANATTSIPDMYGPGMSGPLAFGGKIVTPEGSKSYDNPHRIYFAFAAYRLANLIKKIREDTKGQDIPINIVAHSQGTIITMLATFLLAKDNVLPADCVILAHSPYAFDPSYAEVLSKDLYMGIQSEQSREKTFINFVKKIKDSQDLRNKKFTPETLKENYIINTTVNPDEKYIQADGSEKQYDRLGKDEEMFYRDNFGKVYHYFSPNDHVVSLWNVQGMGWKGIPDHIIKACHENLRQRVFSHKVIAGNNPINPNFILPLVSMTINEQDYPDYISLEDYKQRVTYVDIGVRGGKVANTVVLLPEQLQRLKQEPLFSKFEGTIEHGHYFAGGRSVIVTYRPTFAEMAKDHPEQTYNKVSSSKMKKQGAMCSSLDELLRDNPSLKIRPYNYVDASIQMLKFATAQCDNYSTGDIQTAPFILTERIINGEEVPETMIYQVDQPGDKTKLSRAIHYGDIYNKNPQKIEKLKQGTINVTVPRPSYIPPSNPIDLFGKPVITDPVLLKKLNDDLKLSDRGIKCFRYIGNNDMGKDKDQIRIYYYLSNQQLKDAIRDLVDSEEDTSSHHSGITNSKEAPAKIMAYDLALGVVNGITPQNQRLLFEWRAIADWRHPENNDTETVLYSRYGILPDDLKKAMNYPTKHMPFGDDMVDNSFYHDPSSKKVVVKELMKEKYRKLSQKPQWPLPDPDIKEP